MNRVAKETAIATAIFVAVVTVFQGGDDMSGTLTSALTFALVYGLIVTAYTIYRSRGE